METTGEPAGIWTPYPSPVWSLLNILLSKSDLYPSLEPAWWLHNSAIRESCSWEMQTSFGVEFSLWCIWPMKIYELLEGFTPMLTNRIYLIECFWYYIHHHQHYHHCYHHHGHYTIHIITISPELNVHTYTYNLLAASSRFCQNIWVLRSNFLLFLPNLKFRFSIT